MDKELQILNTLELELKQSMVALSNNPEYKRMIELDNQIEDIKAGLKIQAKSYLKELGTKTIDTELVRITLATRRSFKIKDVSKVKPELLEVKLDTKKISNYLDLYQKLPEGVDMTETEYVIWKDK